MCESVFFLWWDVFFTIGLGQEKFQKINNASLLGHCFGVTATALWFRRFAAQFSRPVGERTKRK